MEGKSHDGLAAAVRQCACGGYRPLRDIKDCNMALRYFRGDSCIDCVFESSKSLDGKLLVPEENGFEIRKKQDVTRTVTTVLDATVIEMATMKSRTADSMIFFRCHRYSRNTALILGKSTTKGVKYVFKFTSQNVTNS